MTDQSTLFNIDDHVICPTCQATQELAPITVIDAGTAVLEELWSGKLNRYVCDACGVDFHVETPLLFRDLPALFLAYLAPNANHQAFPTITGHLDTLVEALFADADASQSPIVRLTTQPQAFIEKIALHQTPYDDRLVEYIKYHLFQHTDDLDANCHDLWYDFTHTTSDTLPFIAFDRNDREAVLNLSVNASTYQELADHMFGDNNPIKDLDEYFPPYYVQVDCLLQPS